jgi:NADH:ubiquinone oxidoreductase subunit D
MMGLFSYYVYKRNNGNAPEFLKNIQIPKRVIYITVIMLELSCIASHLLWLGPFMADPKAQTPLFYIFRENWYMIYLKLL